MLLDTEKYPPVIKSHSIYKGIQPCGSLVLQLFKMGVKVTGKNPQAQEHQQNTLSEYLNVSFVLAIKWRYLKS